MITKTMLDDYHQIINKIPGVISSKAVTGEEGNITEIHILSDTSRGPKQIVRDIQSVLLAKFDQTIDHKIVSVAQIEDGGFTPRDFRLAIGSVQISSQQGRIEACVVLTKDDQAYEGRAAGGNTVQGRLRVIAEAALQAVHRFLNKDYVFVLSDAIKVNLADKKGIAVSVFHFTEHGEESLSGSCIIKGDDSEAVVKATLDAINRRLYQYYIK